nr:uncharacterized protein LOC116806881 isoform X5 [Taeniopygia guttata]
MPLNPPAVAAPPLQISLPHRAHSPGLGSGRAACLASFPAAISRVLLDPHPTPTNPHLPPLWHRCFRSKKMKETIMNQEKLAKLQAQVRIGGKGCKNSLTICQWYVAQALSGVRKQFPDVYCYHYMDDILVTADVKTPYPKNRVW